MRVIQRALALSVAMTILAAASIAGAAWRFEEGGPHPRIVKKQRSAVESTSKESFSSAPTHARVCKRRTVKPFQRYCVRSADSASR